jgi:hypothetical protein
MASTLNNPLLARKAKQLGESLSKENGIETAIQAIEKFIANDITSSLK